MPFTMKQRLKKVSQFLLILFILGTLYYLWGKYTGLFLPCIIHETTGLYCPGCGITRMIVSLIQGNLKAALHYNTALFFLLPILAVILIFQMIQYIKKGKIKISAALNVFLILTIIILVLFGILRNLPDFYFLRP